MKTLITLAFVLLAGPALATELAVPKLKPRPANAPAAPTADPKAACLARKAAECEAKNWTWLGKQACYRVKSRACR